MNKLQLRIAGLVSIGILILSAGARSETSKETTATGPLRFQHIRPHTAGLYEVVEKTKPLRVPEVKSKPGMPEIVANCTSSKVGYGMYSFYAEPNLTLEKIGDTPAFFGGGVYVNGKYYGADYDYDYSTGALSYVKWYIYDAQTWRCEKVIDNPLDYSYLATDRTYDPSTGKVFSIVYDKTGQAIQLATTSLSDGSSTPIAVLSKNVIMLTSDTEGQLYGIDTEANLYKINKRTAGLTLVGNTRIYDDYLSEYTQSIEYDKGSGKILWAEFHSEGLFSGSSTLFSVDPATAVTEKISAIPGGAEMIGMYITEYMAEGVPTAPTLLRAIPEKEGSLNISFGFQSPAKNVSGETITEQITIEVEIDGDLADILEVVPGEEIITNPFTLTRGLHTLKLIPSTSAGEGESAVFTFYAGYDVPASPNNISLICEDGENILRWDSPVTGAEGGVIRGPLTYTIYRMPDEVMVAESLAGNEYKEKIEKASRYSYRVMGVSPDGVGAAGESNSVVSGYCELPFITGFDSESDFNLWTIADITSGGKVWNYDDENRRLRHPWSIDNEIDDYIISPGLKMDGTKTYSVGFDAYQMVDSYDEHVMLYFGSSTDPSTMTLILDTDKLGVTPVRFEGTVAPSETGIWYIAFRSKTGKNGFMSYVDNVEVKEKGSSSVAACVDNLKAEAADGGVLEVKISFDVPGTTMQGGDIGTISHIDILRGENPEPIKIYESPAPGTHLEMTDNLSRGGLYTYKVVVYTEAGAGEPAMADVYAGIDRPLAPSNLRVSGEDGSRELKWDAPKSGENGGNLNGLVSYNVRRMVNNTESVIGERLDATEYVDTWSAEEQAFVYYTVTAVTEAGESAGITSESFAVGNPYKLPYQESFAEGMPQTQPWTVDQVTGNQGSWSIKSKGSDPYINPQDNDGGLAEFDGYHSWTNGCELRLISPTISLDKVMNTVLSFYFYHFNGKEGWWQEDPDPVGETMSVEISVNGKPFEKIPGGEYTLYSTTSGWKKYELPLDAYRSKGVRIAFRGKGAGNFNIHLDNIEIQGDDDPSAAEELQTSETMVTGIGVGKIYYRSATDLDIYDMGGIHIARLKAGEGEKDIPSGIYIIKSENEIYKIIVK